MVSSNQTETAVSLFITNVSTGGPKSIKLNQ